MDGILVRRGAAQSLYEPCSKQQEIQVSKGGHNWMFRRIRYLTFSFRVHEPQYKGIEWMY